VYEREKKKIKQLENNENKKGNIFSVCNTQAYTGSRSTAEFILNLEGEEWSNSRPGRFTSEKEPPVPNPVDRSGGFVVDKNPFPRWNSNPGSFRT
jgi:hypothetical protein